MFYVLRIAKPCPPTLPKVNIPKTALSPKATLPSITGFQSKGDAVEQTSSCLLDERPDA